MDKFLCLILPFLRSGFVDVWSNEEGTEPQYTFTCEGDGCYRLPSALQLWEKPHSVYLAVSHGHTVQVHTIQNGEGHLKDRVVFDSVVSVVGTQFCFSLGVVFFERRDMKKCGMGGSEM